MSLINKMLKDLDARGGQAAARPHVLPRGQRNAPRMVMGGLALAAILGVVGAVVYAAYAYFKKPPPPAKPSVAMIQAATVPVRPVIVASAPAAAAEPVQKEDAQQDETAPAPAPAHDAVAVTRPEQAAETDDAGAEEEVAAPAAQRSTPAKPVRSVGTVKGGPVIAGVREMTPQQKAESDYKRANISLQEGRITEAIATLERVLQVEPRHDAARQTLVGLLVEARRSEEAIRILQAGLVLEPKQPNMAMLLARLQIERGGPGVETLLRTLPYATGNAEYHGFLAGALQRELRHREAIEQYQAALQVAPQNGVWLMGLGISLLAEKRNPEAIDAFKRAKASGNLTPELATYVDRRLQQLGR